MDLDTFFVPCERLEDSRLNGNPILIGGAVNKTASGITARDANPNNRLNIIKDEARLFLDPL